MRGMRDAAKELYEDLPEGRHELTNAELRSTFGLPRVTVSAREQVADALDAAGFEILSNPEEAPLVIRKPPPGAAGSSSETTGRRPLVWVGAGIAALIVLGIVATAAFFIGQGTRKSDAVVALEEQAAVKQAVVAAVRENNEEQRAVRRRALERAERALKRRNRVVIRRVVSRLKRASERRASQSFASGSQAGYQSGSQAGFEQGEQAGLFKASDELVCSDDSDVPLPAC